MHVDAVVCVFQLIFASLWRRVLTLPPEPSVPDHVVAPLGSCVVIPCSFTPSGSRYVSVRDQVDVRLSYKGGMAFLPFQRTLAFTSESRQPVSREFQGRLSLAGEISKGDCSVKIDRVKWIDWRVFDLALKKRLDDQWGEANSVSVDVVASPQAPVISGVSSATEGQLVTMNCSVNFTCPSKPPMLQWRLDKSVQAISSEQVQTYLAAHGPTLLASLSFNVSHDVKPILRCVVSYPGGQKATAVKDLHVTFSPKDVRVEVQSLMVMEGGSALLACTCKADPPASGYHWSYSQRGKTVRPFHRTHAIRVYNVTRDMMVHCSAQNVIGRGESPFTSLNVQYKPSIQPLNSSCVVEGLNLRCHCSVDANPRAAVTWSINGTVPTREYNISVTSNSEVTTSSLRGRMNKPMTVICFASNTHGNDSWVLLQGGDDTELNLILWLMVPAVAISAVLLLVLLLLYCCRKRVSARSSQFPGRIYEDHMPLYINCAEVTHIYTNGSYQLVYQNCTPMFVHNKQIRPMARRGGERRLGERRRGKAVGQSQKRLGERDASESTSQAAADAETAIYLEVL